MICVVVCVLWWISWGDVVDLGGYLGDPGIIWGDVSDLGDYQGDLGGYLR